jgi:hypothetical protein
MERVTDAQWKAVALAQQYFGLSDSLCALMVRCTEVTLRNNRKKRGWTRGENLDPGDPRLEYGKVLAGVDGRLALHVTKIRHMRKVINEPLQIPPLEGTTEELTERMRELFRSIQTKFLMRMSDGTLTQLERMDHESISEDMRQYDKIQQSMIRAGLHLRESPGAEQGFPMPTAEELRALMDKIEKRINELATRRAERLAAEKSQCEGGGLGHPGVDVHGTAQSGA